MDNDNDYIPALKYKGLTKLYDPLLKFFNAGQKLTAKLLAQAAITEGDKLLDFGCGPGNLLIQAKQKQPQAVCRGIDIDPRILKIAAEKIDKHGLNIPLKHYSGGTLPYKNESFDKVLSGLVFHHLSYNAKRKALQEIHRILKPRGKLHIMDFGKPSNLLMRLLFIPVQLLDGFSPTADNVLGLLPEIVSKAGFANVIEKDRLNTLVGTLSFYQGEKPQNNK
ncbi:MAG: class I SAM-dependent methyltransferase [Firmicutes bacterium]|nr:class I SAM-dependent methyltransferase [Bacillota bacterium]